MNTLRIKSGDLTIHRVATLVSLVSMFAVALLVLVGNMTGSKKVAMQPPVSSAPERVKSSSTHISSSEERHARALRVGHTSRWHTQYEKSDFRNFIRKHASAHNREMLGIRPSRVAHYEYDNLALLHRASLGANRAIQAKMLIAGNVQGLPEDQVMANAVVQAFAGTKQASQRDVEGAPDITGAITIPKDHQLEHVNGTGKTGADVKTVSLAHSGALAVGMTGYSSSQTQELDRKIIYNLLLLLLVSLSLVSFAVARQKR